MMKTIVKWILSLILIGALAATGWTTYQKYGATQTTQAAANTPLQTVKLATGALQTTVSATGAVRANQTALVSWKTSGTIGAIAVAEGDSVQAGQALASLATTSLSNAILTAQADLATAQEALLTLTHNQTALYQAEKDVITAQAAVDKAQNHRAMLNADTRGTTAQIAQAQQAYDRAQDALNRARALYERLPGDPATELHNKAPALILLEEAKTARNTALAALNWYAAPWSASDIAAADQALAVARASLAEKQAALARLQAGPDTAALAAARLRIADDQATINTQTLTAPIGGTVTSLTSQVGDLVDNGTVTLRIDDPSAYYVDLAVAEGDVTSVEVGQPVVVTFDAIAGQTYPGQVTAIAQVGTSSSGGVNFTVTVRITDADAAIKPGMTAAASIVTQTVANALVVPARAIKSLNGRKVVYLTDGTRLTPVGVTVGLETDAGVQITSSQLKAGDLIALNPTTGTSTKSSQ